MSYFLNCELKISYFCRDGKAWLSPLHSPLLVFLNVVTSVVHCAFSFLFLFGLPQFLTCASGLHFLCLPSLHADSMKLEIIIVSCISEDQNFTSFMLSLLRPGVVNHLSKTGSSKTGVCSWNKRRRLAVYCMSHLWVQMKGNDRLLFMRIIITSYFKIGLK